jgi:hypothetical protein
MDEAKKQGIRVVGHVPLTVTTAEASDAGLASIEHTETLFEAAVTNGELLDLNGASIHKYLADHGSALFAKFVANHTVFTPTLRCHASSGTPHRWQKRRRLRKRRAASAAWRVTLTLPDRNGLFWISTRSGPLIPMPQMERKNQRGFRWKPQRSILLESVGPNPWYAIRETDTTESTG